MRAFSGFWSGAALRRAHGYRPSYRPAAARLPGRTGLIVGFSSFFSLSQLGRVSSHHFADSHSSMHLAILVSISALERPEWSKAGKCATLEAVRSSTRGSGWAPCRSASSWECRAGQSRQARPEEAQRAS